ncbi:type I secretion system permease/ATPase [Methylomagnum sp.]
MSLRGVFSECRLFFVYGGLFSFATNLLALAVPLYMLQVFNRVISSRSNETLFVLTLIFVVALITDAMIDVLRSRLFIRLGDTIYTKLRGTVLNAVLRFHRQADANKHGLEDLDAIRAFVSGSGTKALFDIPWIPIFFGVLWMFHPALALLAVVSSIIMFGLTYIEEVVTKKNQTEANAKRRESADFIGHAFRNAEAMSALGMRGEIQKRWQQVDNQYLSESFAAIKKISLITGLSKFTKASLTITSMGTAAFLVINVEGMSPGVMIASTILMGKTIAPIVTVLAAWRSFIGFRAAYHRLDELLKEQQAIQAGFEHLPPTGILSVERLLFFLDRNRTILNGVDFRLEAGEVLGIIGASGSGKTSLARLMVGLYQPSDGTIRLDGADVYQWSQNNLGQYIGYLPQESQLFKGTVAENIARLGDAYSQVELVIEAAQRAGIHDMILRLPKGYDTDVGVGGAFLSGGQKQLIALARALFRRPQFVVLDEPNSNLDGQSELSLLEVIRDLKAEGVTVVVIAHKPSLLQDVDKMLVLGQGKQLMFGPREDIMKRLGHTGGVMAVPGKMMSGDGIAA